jgi:3',5'-cyclic-AMP phosphodiesterase
VRQLGQHPAPRHTVAHLSDPHLLADGRLQYGAVDTEALLARALERLRAVDPVPQAIVLTGDLADRAEPAAYARVRALVEPAAEAIGATVVWVMGNHDERAPYARELFDSDDDGPQDRVHEVDGLRIVALDTSVPGYHHGDLTDAQLDWLAGVLATPAPHGTLLAMHHPPIPLPMLRAAELIELREQDRLAQVVAGTDVRGILSGHLHFTTWSTFAGVPVSVASASCYTSDPAPVERFVSGVDGSQAFTMLHAYDDRLVHTVVPLVAGPEVNGIGIDVLEALGTISLEEAVELASSKTSAFNTGGGA